MEWYIYVCHLYCISDWYTPSSRPKDGAFASAVRFDVAAQWGRGLAEPAIDHVMPSQKGWKIKLKNKLQPSQPV